MTDDQNRPDQDRPDRQEQPQPGQAAPEQPDPADQPAAGPRSGLRNPAGAVRGVGAGTLVLEAIVLLLAIQPIRMLSGRLSGYGVGAMAVLAGLCIVLAALLRRNWAWYAGIGLQVLVLATGVFQLAIAVLGLVFGGIWLYVLHVRRTVLG